jgi:hypothetical protein
LQIGRVIIYVLLSIILVVLRHLLLLTHLRLLILLIVRAIVILISHILSHIGLLLIELDFLSLTFFHLGLNLSFHHLLLLLSILRFFHVIVRLNIIHGYLIKIDMLVRMLIIVTLWGLFRLRWL